MYQACSKMVTFTYEYKEYGHWQEKLERERKWRKENKGKDGWIGEWLNKRLRIRIAEWICTSGWKDRQINE